MFSDLGEGDDDDNKLFLDFSDHDSKDDGDEESDIGD